MNYLFLFCSKKLEDEKKSLILVDKFTVRFTNGELISTKHNMSIKKYIRKYLLLSIVVIIQKDLELETCSIQDQKLDTESITVSRNNNRGMAKRYSRVEEQMRELLQLRNKLSNIEVLLQSIRVNKGDKKKAKVKDMEGFIRQIATEYVQTRREPLNKIRLDFQKNQQKNHLWKSRFDSRIRKFWKIIKRTQIIIKRQRIKKKKGQQLGC